MRKKKRARSKTNLQTNIQERSHLEEGQESKLVSAQTKLQPSKPIKLQRNLQQTLLLSCQKAKLEEDQEREKGMKRNEEKPRI